MLPPTTATSARAFSAALGPRPGGVGALPSPAPARPQEGAATGHGAVEGYLFAERVLERANRESWIHRTSSAIQTLELAAAPIAVAYGVIAGLMGRDAAAVLSEICPFFCPGFAVHAASIIAGTAEAGTRDVYLKEIEPLLARFDRLSSSERALAAATVADRLPGLNARREIEPDAEVRLRELVARVPDAELAAARRALEILSQLRVDPKKPSLDEVRDALLRIPDDQRGEVERLARAALLEAPERSWHGLRRAERRAMADALFPAPGAGAEETLLAELSLFDVLSRRTRRSIPQSAVARIGGCVKELGIDGRRRFVARAQAAGISDSALRETLAHAG